MLHQSTKHQAKLFQAHQPTSGSDANTTDTPDKSREPFESCTSMAVNLVSRGKSDNGTCLCLPQALSFALSFVFLVVVVFPARKISVPRLLSGKEIEIEVSWLCKKSKSLPLHIIWLQHTLSRTHQGGGLSDCIAAHPFFQLGSIARCQQVPEDGRVGDIKTAIFKATSIPYRAWTCICCPHHPACLKRSWWNPDNSSVTRAHVQWICLHVHHLNS